MSDATSKSVHPVDEVLPAGRLTALGLQHMLVMYAGAIAVPLIIGGALKLPKEQIALLINADLFACGIVTLIQCLGVGPFGIRLPIMMGVTFVSVTPMLAIANDPAYAGHAINVIFGSVIAAGIFGILVAPIVSRISRLFPPIVTGTIIAVIGISLLRVGINWAAGGAPMIAGKPNPVYGDLFNLGMALFVMVSILLIARYSKGFLGNIAVLCGLAIGFVVAIALGKVSFDRVAEAKWFDIVMPFAFGAPRFEFAAVATMCVVILVVMVESTGMFYAVGDTVGRPVHRPALQRGLLTDGLGTLIGGIFNTFPYTSYSQNVGLVAVTGVRSRWVCVAGGVILLALGLVPKLATIAASIPQYVLGGAGIVMFGMVAATGIKILAEVDYKHRHNLFIVAISVGLGMIPLVAPAFFAKMPKEFSVLLHSGIVLSAFSAVLLNLFFNGLGGLPSAAEDDEDTTPAKA